MNLGFAAIAAVDDPSGALNVSAQVSKQLRVADEDVQGRRRPGVAAAGSLSHCRCWASEVKSKFLPKACVL